MHRFPSIFLGGGLAIALYLLFRKRPREAFPLWIYFILASLAAVLSESPDLLKKLGPLESDPTSYEAMASDLAFYGQPPELARTSGTISYVAFLAHLYKWIGTRDPVFLKLVNILFAMGSIWLTGRISRILFEREGKVLWLFSLWPSFIYFSSQLNRDVPVTFLMVFLLYQFLKWRSGQRGWDLWLSLPCASALSFLRPQMFLLLAGVLMLWFFCEKIWRLYQQGRPGRAACLLLVFICTLALSYKSVTQFLSPLSVSQFHATGHLGTRLRTRLFPFVEIENYFQLFLFSLLTVFYSNFMPLPFLYPIEGSPRRFLASFENLVLLGLCAWAVYRLFHVQKSAPQRLFIFALIFMAAVASLYEPDLGSAMRHKMMFYPMLFPILGWALQKR